MVSLAHYYSKVLAAVVKRCHFVKGLILFTAV